MNLNQAAHGDNELAADPDSLASDEAGVTIDIYRHGQDGHAWPYYPRPQLADGERRDGERARTRLIPYHQWANRGPATMRTRLPLASTSRSPAKEPPRPTQATFLRWTVTERSDARTKLRGEPRKA